MGKAEPAELVRLLRQQVLRIRTGILLLPLGMLGHELELAARLDVEALDWRGWKLKQLDPHDRYLGLSYDRVVRDLRQIVEDISIPGTPLWIYNTDLFLSALRYSERQRFWTFLYSTFKQRRGLLFSLPMEATNLLPMEERRAWEREKRLAQWEGA